ncbi:MAG: dihydrofolate reductase [Cetobacterium sp.]
MISLIVAMDENKLIGSNNSMPWNIPEDLKLFKTITTDNIIIMGRKTFEAIGKALPNRLNFVLTKNSNFNADNIEVFSSPEELLKNCFYLQKTFNKKIFIIGGSIIYKYFLPIIDEFHISHIKGKYLGDTYFPDIDFLNFHVINKKEFKDFTYIHYSKKHL